MTRKFDVAVVGATGAVGETMLEILAERDFPVNNVYPLASARSAGKKVAFKGRQLTVQDLDTFDFSQVQIGLFSAGASVSEKYAPKAAAAGCIVIDNTSQYRYDDDIPLVVPEVNPEAIRDYTNRGIIANPNCSTIQMLVALKPIQDAAGIERIRFQVGPLPDVPKKQAPPPPPPGAEDPAADAALGSVSVLFSPPEVAVSVGETASVAVLVVGAQDLEWVELEVTWDDALAEVSEVAPGSLLILDGAPVAASQNARNLNENNRIASEGPRQSDRKMGEETGGSAGSFRKLNGGT